ncbi:SurA N-terminal domain-containing protein [Amylibacter sp.]|nr:SurA N-terminal domain-containing protein [Amylibacter sp.]MDC1294403.1 SurA N-terminal domain-containing protein [Amylibacter sp.]
MHFIKIVIIISSFLFPFTAVAETANTFKVAVEVNDQIITNYEISQRIKMLETFGAKSVSKKEVINSLINERLYTYSAIELQALPENSEIDKGLNDFAKRGNLNKKDLLAYLDARNVSQETLIAYITAGLTQRKVIQKKFVNNIIISQGDVESAIDTENVLSKSNSNVIEYIELKFSNLLSDKKSFKQLSTINKMVDNCLDLQSEAKDYENINLEIHKKKTNDLQKDVLDKLNNLDIYETKLIKNTNNINYLLMLCSRNSEMGEDTIEILRNKIFNSRINKIGNAYIQELKGEAFIDIK